MIHRAIVLVINEYSAYCWVLVKIVPKPQSFSSFILKDIHPGIYMLPFLYLEGFAIQRPGKKFHLLFGLVSIQKLINTIKTNGSF